MSELTELLEEVRRIQVYSNRLVTNVMAGGYSSVFRGSGIEFDEVREYVEGDDPRNVDWNVTARVGRPYLKTYVDERELAVLFLLDLSASMSGGFGTWSLRQMAARVCACLALSAVRNNDRVGLLAFSDRVERSVPARRGIRHALRVVRDCLALPAAASATDPVPALEMVARAVRRRAIVFVVSDFLPARFPDPGESTRRLRALALCARRHDVVAVRLSPPELAPPRLGLVRLEDPESGTQAVVDWSSPRVRTAYGERVRAWRKDLDAGLRRARVDCMDVPVPTEPDRNAVVQPILDFFRMRELRGAKR